MEEIAGIGLYLFLQNRLDASDLLGLANARAETKEISKTTVDLYDFSMFSKTLFEKTKSLPRWGWVKTEFSFSLSGRGSIEYTNKKCCTGDFAGTIVRDESYSIKVDIGIEFRAATLAWSGTFAGFKASAWFGLNGTIAGTGTISAGASTAYCDGQGLEGYAKVSYSISAALSFGGQASISVWGFQKKLGAYGTISGHVGHDITYKIEDAQLIQTFGKLEASSEISLTLSSGSVSATFERKLWSGSKTLTSSL